jgi:hypothetical protein
MTHHRARLARPGGTWRQHQPASATVRKRTALRTVGLGHPHCRKAFHGIEGEAPHIVIQTVATAAALKLASAGTRRDDGRHQDGHTASPRAQGRPWCAIESERLPDTGPKG